MVISGAGAGNTFALSHFSRRMGKIVFAAHGADNHFHVVFLEHRLTDMNFYIVSL